MRIVTWNCNRALGRKLPALMALRPDIAIVQECERDLAVPAGYAYVWSGSLPRMGLGVLARDRGLLAHSVIDRRWTHFLPVGLPALKLRVLATWAFQHRAAKLAPNRIGSCLPVLQTLGPWLAQGRSIMAGDFNHHPRWDKPRGRNNFADACGRLQALGLRSAYHAATGEAHGSETHDTHFLQRNSAKAYHIDYCFVHTTLTLLAASIEPFEAWSTHSDHVPLVVDVADG